MLVVLSKLPKEWRNRETAEYLQTFLTKLLEEVLRICAEQVKESKNQMVSVTMLNIALTRIGMSMKTLKFTNNSTDKNSFSVTQSCISNAITESKLSVKKNTREELRRAAQAVVNLFVAYANPLKRPVSAEPDSVVRRLRSKMLASVSN